MANTFPGDRFTDARAQSVTVYSDAKCSQLAPITTLAGAPIARSILVIGPDGLWPYFAANLPTVYVRDARGFIIRWYPASPAVQGATQPPTAVTGSRSTGAAMTSLIAALALQGMNITDGTVA